MTSSGRELALSIGRAAAVVGGIYVALHYLLPAATGITPIPFLNLTLASASALLMNATGFEVSQSATILTFRGASVIVTNDCNGFGAWLLTVGAMSALPAIPLAWRAAGMVAAALAISCVNIVRIAILCFLQAERPAWFAPFHEQVAPLVVVLTAFACFTVWMRSVEHAPAR